MKSIEKVAIIGTGFMGNSIASALFHKKSVNTIYGIEPNDSYRKTSQQTLCYQQLFESISGFVESAKQQQFLPDVILICTPVNQVVQLVVECFNEFPNAVISDIGSTKAQIVNETNQRLEKSPHHFVGGHPIAGGDTTGPIIPPDSIFTNRLFVLTPTESTSKMAIQKIENLWRSIDCQTLQLSPEEHDQLLGMTSHMPHLVSSALSASLESNEADFCGTGWRDTTRIAKSNPLLWKEILVHNRGSIQAALNRFNTVFSNLQMAVGCEDWEAVITILEKGKQNRDALGN